MSLSHLQAAQVKPVINTETNKCCVAGPSTTHEPCYCVRGLFSSYLKCTIPSCLIRSHIDYDRTHSLNSVTNKHLEF